MLVQPGRVAALVAASMVIAALPAREAWPAEASVFAAGAADRAVPLRAERVGGLLGERLRAWRDHRLQRVGTDAFLLEGFESPPGRHPWQGEHVGKWLHAASLAYEATGDERIGRLLRHVAGRLTAAQQPNGYLGTYALERRFYNADAPGAKWSWDVWTHRYVLYGLLAYDRVRPDPAAVRACLRVGDLLLDCFGPGRRDVTELGTRHGLSSATLLESVMMLYERTGETRFLQFAEHLVGCIERNPELRVGAVLRAGGDVSVPGDGKAYQLMAVLLGYAELYRCTGRREYLEPALAAWENIRDGHLYVTGGPWSFKSTAAKNQECFARPEFFHPTNCVETCSTTTWIQLCLSLWRITGQAEFAAEAERAVLNHLIGAQSPNGNDWAYFTMPNQPDRGYKDQITCCASSGPRALELFAASLAGRAGDALAINSYPPMSVPIESVAGTAGRIVVEGDYPLAEEAVLRLDAPRPVELAVDLALPVGARSLEAWAQGERLPLQRTASGYYRIRRVWRPGQRVRVRWAFPVRAHFRTSRDGVRWLAFTRGPIVLAQHVAAQGDQPQVILPADTEHDAAELVEPVGSGGTPRGQAASVRAAAVSRWRLRTSTGRKVLLIPYYLAGASGGGVRTLFPTIRSSETKGGGRGDR